MPHRQATVKDPVVRAAVRKYEAAIRQRRDIKPAKKKLIVAAYRRSMQEQQGGNRAQH